MARVTSSLLLHLMLFVSGDESRLSKRERLRTNAFVARWHRRERHRLEAVSVEEDHAHVLVGLRPSVTPRLYVRRLKASIARWVNRRRTGNARFRWRYRWMIYSVSSRTADAERGILTSQQRIHEKRDAETELALLLRRQRINPRGGGSKPG